jgi:DNA adenine methylase
MSALLRYPGGKSRVFPIIWRHVAPIIQDRYAEPFAGGGSTFMGAAAHKPDAQITINDKDAEVACFWRVVCGDGADFEALCREVSASQGPTDDPARRFDYWNKIRDSKPDEPAKQAFRFIFLNKTTFGGQIDASPIGGWNQDGWKGRGDRLVVCQYGVGNILKNLRKARKLLAGRTTVYNLDVTNFLDLIPPTPLYVDPPYFPTSPNKLYRVGMTPAEHAALAARLRDYECPWVLSYDDCAQVRSLYSWASFYEMDIKYSSAPAKKNWKQKIELIIKPMDQATEQPTTAPAAKQTPRKKPEVRDLTEVISPTYIVWAALNAHGGLLPCTASTTKEGAAAKADGAVVRQFTMTIIQ